MRSLYFKISFICLLFAFKSEKIEAQGQPWVENNALWISSFTPINVFDTYGGAYEVKKVGDTLIGSNVCDKLIRTIYIVNGESPMNLFVTAYESSMFYTYKSINGDSIFYSYDDSIDFQLLYDFSRNIGDSVVFNRQINSDNSLLDSNYYRVFSSQDEMLGGQMIQSQKIGIINCDSVSAIFTILQNYHTYCNDLDTLKINKRFGYSSHSQVLIPEKYSLNPIGYEISNLLFECFKDDSLEVGQNCDFIEGLYYPDYFKLNKIQISPNPFNSSFEVSNINEEVQIEIINEQGKLLYSRFSTGDSEEITLDLIPGFYFVKITSKSGRSICKKIVKL